MSGARIGSVGDPIVKIRNDEILEVLTGGSSKRGSEFAVSQQGEQSHKSETTPGVAGQKNGRGGIKRGLSGMGENFFSSGNQANSSEGRAGRGLTPLVPETDRNPMEGSKQSVTAKNVASNEVSRALSL